MTEDFESRGDQSQVHAQVQAKSVQEKKRNNAGGGAEIKKNRHSRSANNQQNAEIAKVDNHQSRHKSAPIHRNVQSREISRNYDASVSISPENIIFV